MSKNEDCWEWLSEECHKSAVLALENGDGNALKANITFVTSTSLFCTVQMDGC